MQYQVPGVIAAAGGTAASLPLGPTAPGAPPGAWGRGSQQASSKSSAPGATAQTLVHYRFASAAHAAQLLGSPALALELSGSVQHTLLRFEGAVENELEPLFMRGPTYSGGYGLLALFSAPDSTPSPSSGQQQAAVPSPSAGPAEAPSARLLGQLAVLASNSGAVQVSHGPLALHVRAASEDSGTNRASGASREEEGSAHSVAHALLARFPTRSALLAFAQGRVMQRLAVPAGPEAGGQRGLPLCLLSYTAFEVASGPKERNTPF